MEEMHKDRDNPMIYIWWIWENLLYGDQPAGWDVIGEEKIIRSLKREDFTNYFHHQYVSKNTAVIIAGNFNDAEATGKVRELFSEIRDDPPFRKKPPVSEDQAVPSVKIEFKETDQTNLVLGFRGYDAMHPKRYAAEVLAVLLGGGMSSRMFIRIREKLGLAYAVGSSHESYSNRGFLTTYAGVDHKNVEQTIQEILKEYKSLCEKIVSAKELKRVKDYIRGTTLIGLEQSNAMASFIGGEEMVTGKPMTVDEVFASIDRVTEDELCAVAKEIMTPEKLNLAMIGPFKDKEKFEKLLREF